MPSNVGAARHRLAHLVADIVEPGRLGRSLPRRFPRGRSACRSARRFRPACRRAADIRGGPSGSSGLRNTIGCAGRNCSPTTSTSDGSPPSSGSARPDDPVIGLVHALKVLPRRARIVWRRWSCGAMWISGSAQTMVESGQRSLDRPRRRDRGPDELALEPAALVGPDAREITVVDRPGQEVDLVQRADERRAAADRLLQFERGQREVGEALGKVVASLVDVIGRAVVEQVPDDLHPDLLGRFQRRQPARPVIFARRFLDQCQRRPSRSVRNPSSLALPVVAAAHACRGRSPG